MYEILEWDTTFFGFNVCRVQERYLTDEALPSLLDVLRKNEIKLAYYSSRKALDAALPVSGSSEIKLVDIKTTYVKKLSGDQSFFEQVTAYKESFPEEKLIELAIQSGVYSRYNTDTRIEKAKFEELYRLWMINSVNKKLAEEVLVYRKDSSVAGFVTLGRKNARADIGIIAVDSSYRGQGIGKLLMRAAEKWFYDNGHRTVQVVTQGNNVPACKLYENCGYSVEQVEYFYHFWAI